jgi:hypothetical protein
LSFSDPPEVLRSKKLLTFLGLILILQVGGCVFTGGDDFLLMPIFCTVGLADWVPNILPVILALMLVSNPLVILAGLAMRRLTPFAVAFAVVTLIAIILQAVALGNGWLGCDGP